MAAAKYVWRRIDTQAMTRLRSWASLTAACSSSSTWRRQAVAADAPAARRASTRSTPSVSSSSTTTATTTSSSTASFLTQRFRGCSCSHGSRSWTGLTTPPGQARWAHTVAAAKGGGASSGSDVQQQPGQPTAAGGPSEPDGLKANLNEGDRLCGGRYQLLMRVTHGEDVWLGADTAGDRPVLRFLKCVEAGDAGSYTAGTREAALHAAAGRHPNIVPLLDAFEHRSPAGRHAVMVLEPDGISLELLARQQGSVEIKMGAFWVNFKFYTKLSQPHVLRHIARHALLALDHLHTQGLAHGRLSLDCFVLDRRLVPLRLRGSDVLRNPRQVKHALRVIGWRVSAAGQGSDGGTPEAVAAGEEAQPRRAGAAQGPSEDPFLRSAVKLKLTHPGGVVPCGGIILPGLPAAVEQAVPPEARQLMRAAAQQPRMASKPASGLPFDLDTPPEELLQLPSPVGPAHDMWRLACLLYRCATRAHLFQGGRDKYGAYEERQRRRRAEQQQQQRGLDASARGDGDGGEDLKFGEDEFLLLDMAEAFGGLPRELARKSPLFEKLFVGKASLTLSDSLRIANVITNQPGSQPVESRLLQHRCMSPQEAVVFGEFLTLMLNFDPAKRPSAAQMLKHRFLQPPAAD